MCGIFGHTLHSGFDLTHSRASLNTLMHRGPDQMGEYTDPNVYLGHRRLSILDLSENGRQPMQSAKTVISVNGEIYNYKALRKELGTKYEFKSQSDSEVVLFGYEEWGLEKLLEKIDGMYAIVVYDKSSNILHLARDRYGIKPLYYSTLNNGLSWGSELKALQTYLDPADLKLDYTAIYDYLTYLYIPTPKTLYQNVFKLAPGHALSYGISTGKLSMTKYWELPISETKISLGDASLKVKALVSESVKEQMISDVPVGFFLSGGIDSSIVVASASEFSKDIHTYSIGFDVAAHNETKYAKIVADCFKTIHNEKILSQPDASELVNNMKKWYDEPYADTSAIPTYLVSRFAKENATVVLTGDGGDELFGGYDWYDRFTAYKTQQLKHISFLKPLVSKIKRRFTYTIVGRIANQLEYRLCNNIELYTKLLGGLLKHEKVEYRKKWNIPDDYNDYWYFEKFYREDLGSRKSLQYLDFHTYLHDDIFTKVDRASMSVSLECRVPFMKKELVEFAFSLPEEILYTNNQLKGLLKVAYQGILPENILQRKKRGFNIPLKQWNKSFLAQEKNQQEFILNLFHLHGA